MEWVIGIYLAIGVIKGLGKLSNSDPSQKPAWMSGSLNPLTLAFMFTLYVLFWPFG
jgi:hypothetical protein